MGDLGGNDQIHSLRFSTRKHHVADSTAVPLGLDIAA
jgi:hypothetical protein